MQNETLADELQSVHKQLAKISDEKCTLVSSVGYTFWIYSVLR